MSPFLEDPASVVLTRYWKPPGTSLARGMRWSGLTSCEILPPVTIGIGECTGVDYSRVLFFLGWWSLLFIQEWWGQIRYGVHGSPIICAGGNRSYLDFFAVTSDLRYPGYKTPTKILECEKKVKWAEVMLLATWSHNTLVSRETNLSPF
jgi:hypothetical protein